MKVEAPPFLKDTARATAQLKQSGRVFRVALRSSGKGYGKTPEVTISPPRSVCSGRRGVELSSMTACHDKDDNSKVCIAGNLV